MGKICCKIDGKIHKARCLEGNDLMVPWDECRTGCIAAKNPCLLAQMKHNWEIVHLPNKNRGEHILRAMGKEQYKKMLKKSFDERNCPEGTRSLELQ